VRWVGPFTQGLAPQDLGSLANGETFATGVTNSGTIVGYSSGSAFLWENNQMLPLSNFIPREAGGGPPVWQLQFAAGITNSGKVAGQGVPNGSGSVQGFVLLAQNAPPPPVLPKLQKLTITPSQIFLNGSDVQVKATLTLDKKPKTAIDVVGAVTFNGELILGVPMHVAAKEGSIQVPLSADAPLGTYTFSVTYNGKTVQDTLVVNKLQLQSVALKPAKAKAGAKVEGTLTFNGAPPAPVTVPLTFYENNKPLPFSINVQVDSAVNKTKIKIPALVPPGVYEVRATFNETVKSVSFTVQ
jgi:hypothetical protein